MILNDSQAQTFDNYVATLADTISDLDEIDYFVEMSNALVELEEGNFQDLIDRVLWFFKNEGH